MVSLLFFLWGGGVGQGLFPVSEAGKRSFSTACKRPQNRGRKNFGRQAVSDSTRTKWLNISLRRGIGVGVKGVAGSDAIAAQ